jgi:hypothetical protein
MDRPKKIPTDNKGEQQNMRYDVSLHVPQQIEALLNGFQKADIPGMERALDNIKTLVKDKKAKQALEDYLKEKKMNIDKIQQKSKEATKTILQAIEAKDFSDIYIDFNEIAKDFGEALEMLERDYWNHIKDYVTLYFYEEPKTETKTDEQ